MEDGNNGGEDIERETTSEKKRMKRESSEIMVHSRDMKDK